MKKNKEKSYFHEDNGILKTEVNAQIVNVLESIKKTGSGMVIAVSFKDDEDGIDLVDKSIMSSNMHTGAMVFFLLNIIYAELKVADDENKLSNSDLKMMMILKIEELFERLRVEKPGL